MTSLASKRVVYGQEGHITPYWIWLLQRVSGLLLGPLVLVHVLVPGAPFMVWLSAMLLGVVLTHAFIALWRLAAMRGVHEAVYRTVYVASLVLTLVLAGFGAALLASLVN